MYRPGGGGHSTFFQVWGCAARISEVWGLRTDISCLSKRGALWAEKSQFTRFGGLWAENIKIWGLVQPENFTQIWGLVSPKIWVKISGSQRPQISKFSAQKPPNLVNWLFPLDNGTLFERQERSVRKPHTSVFRAAHPHTPFLGQCPPPPGTASKLSTFFNEYSKANCLRNSKTALKF